MAHEGTYPPRESEYGAILAGLIETGHGLSGMDYQKIILRWKDFRGLMEPIFETVDLLVMSVQPYASLTLVELAAMVQEPDKLSGLLRFTAPFDMSGNPTIMLPCGFTGHGTPFGVQFVARHFVADLLCRAGFAYQEGTDWHHKHPVLN